MNKTLITVCLILFLHLGAIGQNLFFIGEKSYPCTESFTFQANSEGGGVLNVLIAKDGADGLIAVKAKSNTRVTFSGKLIIYLVDGSVITCIDKGTSEHVDDLAIAVYNLTNEELNKMKVSNIHTIKFTLKCQPCHGFYSYEEGNWTVSNKNNNVSAVITEFFK